MLSCSYLQHRKNISKIQSKLIWLQQHSAFINKEREKTEIIHSKPSVERDISETASEGKGLWLQYIHLVSLDLGFCLFSFYRGSRISCSNFLELLSPRPSRITGIGSQCLKKSLHLILRLLPQAVYDCSYISPSPVGQSHVYPTGAQEQLLISSCHLRQLHKYMVMWIRKVLPLPCFPLRQ